MPDQPPERPDRGERRVIGRSRRAEPDHVVVAGPDPKVQAAAGPGSSAAPPGAAPAGPPPPAGAAPGPRPVTVIGRSSATSPRSTVAPPPATDRPGGQPPAADAGGRGRRAAPRPPRQRGAFPWRRVLIIGLVVLLALPLGLFLFGWWQFSRIPRVDVATALSPGGGAGTNYLIVGTDSREGIDPDAPDAGAFLAEDVAGSRTDTMMVLRMEGGGARLLSVPRDLWVANPATGEMGRINSTFAEGPANLVTAVRALGIPVHHYLEINFVSFGRLVDAVGGITVEVPAPARDANSGLAIEEAGRVTLDGPQALAYVRSRYYEELVDGTWRSDPTGDIGRTERQRAFLSAMMAAIGNERNPLSLARIPGSLGSGMKIDDTLSYLDALGLAWDFRGSSPAAVALPVTPRTTSGGASVLELEEPAAAEVIASFAA